MNYLEEAKRLLERAERQSDSGWGTAFTQMAEVAVQIALAERETVLPATNYTFHFEPRFPGDPTPNVVRDP